MFGPPLHPFALNALPAHAPDAPSWGGKSPPDLRVTVSIDFDNATNPLMAAVPNEVIVWLENAHSLRLTADAFGLEVEATRCGHVAALNRLAEVMVLMVLRQVIDQGVRHIGLFGALAHPSLHRALVSIHDCPARSWSIEQLADEAGMSRTQFMTTFRHLVGMTPMAYVLSWRLALAHRDLKAGHSVKR